MAEQQTGKEFYADLVHNILLYVTPNNFVPISRTCKLWRRVLNSDGFCKDYICTFFKLDSYGQAYLEYLFRYPVFDNIPTFKLTTPTFKLTKYSQILVVLSKVYYDFSGVTEKFEKVVNSLDRNQLSNEQYVKNTIRDIELLKSKFEIIPDTEVQFLDLDDVLFRIYNCKAKIFITNTYEDNISFAMFSFCGYPIKVELDRYDLHIDEEKLFDVENGYYHLSRRNENSLEKMQKIFNIQYQPVGYSGIDETFSHELILETIYVYLFQQIVTYCDTSSDFQDETNYKFVEVPYMKDLILDMRYSYGRNAFRKIKIEKPTKQLELMKQKQKQSIIYIPSQNIPNQTQTRVVNKRASMPSLKDLLN